MAGKEFPLSLIIRAVDKATAPLQRITGKIGGISAAAASLGKTLSVGVTLPLVGLGTAGVAAFGKFEEGMSNVGTLIDTNVESLAEMSTRVRELGRRIPVPIDQLVSGLTEARSAGVSASDQFGVLEGSAKLAIVGLGQVSEAVDIVTSAMNSFNLKGKDAERIYNTIFQATNVGKASISDLAQGFGAVAGTVASAGVSLEEYMASVAALTTTGLPAAAAHTQLRAVIAGLTRETKLSKPLFDHLGAKSFKDLIAKSGGLVPAINRIKTALSGNDARLLKVLGSTEALNAVLGLTGNQAAAFREALGLMQEGGDAFEKKFTEKTKTFAATMQSLQNSLRDIAISIGAVLVPVLQDLAPRLQSLADWWSRLGSGTQTSIVAFGAAAAALGPVLTVIGNVGTVFTHANKAVTWAAGWGKYLWMMRASILSGLVPSLVAATSSVWAFTAALLANPITWIVLGIAALAGAAYLIYDNWDWICGFFSDLWDGIMEVFGPAIDWLTELFLNWTPLGLIIKHWDPIKAWFGRLWDGVKQVIGPAIGWLTDVFLNWTPVGLIIKHWEPIKSFFAELWDGVVGLFKWAWEQIQPIVDLLKGAFDYTPFGLAAKVYNAFSRRRDERAALEAQRPTLDVDGAAPPGVRGSEAHVVVDFNNLPKGARVSQDPGSSAPLDLSLGYSMVTP